MKHERQILNVEHYMFNCSYVLQFSVTVKTTQNMIQGYRKLKAQQSLRGCLFYYNLHHMYIICCSRILFFLFGLALYFCCSDETNTLKNAQRLLHCHPYFAESSSLLSAACYAMIALSK